MKSTGREIGSNFLTVQLQLLLLVLVLTGLMTHGTPIAERAASKNATVSVMIIPSTKWCGNGNVASSYDSLGTEYETDKCCRDHDTCPHHIVGLQTLHGLRNPYLTTISDCECDVRFYFCLKQAAKMSATAQFALDSFFRLLSMPCFELVQRPVCQRRQSPLGPCLAERNETVAELRQLPFFVDHLARALASGALKFRV